MNWIVKPIRPRRGYTADTTCSGISPYVGPCSGEYTEWCARGGEAYQNDGGTDPCHGSDDYWCTNVTACWDGEYDNIGGGDLGCVIWSCGEQMGGCTGTQ